MFSSMRASKSAMNALPIAIALMAATLTPLAEGRGQDSAVGSGSSAPRTVRGEVAAVTADAMPPVIVMKTVLADKGEMIVRATLEDKTEATRSRKQIALSDLKVGETVSLVCRKTPDGLIAQSIYAQ